MAFGEESEGIKEVWAWPKLKVAVSFLKHLETRLGQAPDRGLGGDSGPVKERECRKELGRLSCQATVGSGQESPGTLMQGS